MTRVSPVWILTTLKGEAFDRFKAEVDNQFSVFSETELQGYAGAAQHKWWEVTQVGDDISTKWDCQTGVPNNIPAFANLTLYDSRQVEVIYHSPLSEFSNRIKIIEELKNDQLFLNIFQNRLFYSVVSFRKEESASIPFINQIDNLESFENNTNLFDAIVFHSDSSRCASNPSGFVTLNDDDYLSLSVNLVFATAMMKMTLASVSSQQNRLFHTAGMFNFVYEPDAYKRNSAYKLSVQLMDAFCNNGTDPEWYNESEAIATFENSTIKKNLHWRSVYEQMHTNFKEEPLDNVYTKPHISPWAMLAYKLRPEYFRKYLRSLLRTVYEKIHDFGALTLMRYKSFTDLRYLQLLEGKDPIDKGQQYARSAVPAFLASILTPDNNGARGLQQARKLIALLKEHLVTQKEEVERVKKWEQPNNKENDKNLIPFPKSNDYPLKDIFDERNKQFTSFYEEESTNHPSPNDNTPEINKNREHNELNDLQDVMQFHPMPLNLFVKAGLLAALLPVTVWVILKMIPDTPDTILKSEILESGTGLTIMYITVAVLVILFAFAKYAFSTLHKIRAKIRKYVAWYYYQIERQTYSMTLEKELDYYDEMIVECERVKKQLDSFIEAVSSDDAHFERYRQSKFQNNILGILDNGMTILKPNILRSELKIGNENYALDVLSTGLFTAINKYCDREMGKTIFKMIQEEADKMPSLKDELKKHWANTLADNIQLFINSTPSDNDISIPAFATGSREENNFNFQAVGAVNATLYPSVFVPVVPSYNWVTLFVSNLGGAGAKWEQLFAGGAMQLVPNYAQGGTIGWFESDKTALFVRMHSFRTLIMKDGDTEKTIFNN